MFRSWRLGSLLGFPVEVNATFLMLLAVMFIWFGGLIGVMLVLLAFASVLLHELGHAVVARALGVRVSGIELSFFGGAAKMVELPKSANHEIAIAAAGPIVSLALAGAGFGLGAMTGAGVLTLVGWINVVIAIFNLIPALPMDGGRILRALLTRKLDYVRATDVSVTVARVFAVLFVVAAVAWGSFQLLLLAPLLWVMGTQERMLARAMAHRYAYDGTGYTERRHGEVEVLGRDPFGFGGGGGDGGGWQGRPLRPWWADVPPPATHASAGAPPRRVVIRQRNGRLILEVLE
ncbi:MAG: site-2 protease family protein [Kofleriaceae bacterium]|nr:site-2 protease family protein [Myxococcales bacterium]MCB9561127.1 site-2 protease family protein [Kofleriaceae bacterium]MCB9571325.1 site-2 protease family protein [Kofleriaceae bacterium]